MTTRLISRPYQWALACGWFLLTVALTIAYLQVRPIGSDSDRAGLLYLSAATFFAATGIVYILRWWVFRILMPLGGLVLGLYAILLVLFGTEDVGGAWVSIPAAVLLVAFALWSLVVGIN